METDKELDLLQRASTESNSTDITQKCEPLKSKGVSKANRQVIKLEFQLAEAKRLAEMGVKDEDLGPLTKPKRIPSEKQLENLKKGLQVRDQNRQKRKEERLQKEEEEKQAMEELLIKKAITAKKRQIQKKKVLDELVPDVETPSPPIPLQKPPQVAAVVAPIVPPKPKIIFY